MKNINKLLLLTALVLLFSLSAKADSVAKYSCGYSADGYNSINGYDLCQDKTYKYSSPEAAAEQVSFAMRDYYSANTSRFENFSVAYPVCNSFGNPYYLYMCTFNANLSYRDLEGKLQSSGWGDRYVMVVLQHDCEQSVSLKGTIGQAIYSETLKKNL